MAKNRGKTGGGPGTNQHGVKGKSQRRDGAGGSKAAIARTAGEGVSVEERSFQSAIAIKGILGSVAPSLADEVGLGDSMTDEEVDSVIYSLETLASVSDDDRVSWESGKEFVGDDFVDSTVMIFDEHLGDCDVDDLISQVSAVRHRQ